MKHEIEHVREGVWAGAVMVWDDAAGTLTWPRGPDNPDHLDGLRMAAMSEMVDDARRQGRVVLRDIGLRVTLEDPAHDPADFLRLIDWHNGCVRCGDVRLPESLRGVEMTPLEWADLPPGVVA